MKICGTCHNKPYIKIGEYKTGTSKWDQKKAEESLQLKIYALIHYKITKKVPPQELVWIQTKMKDAKPTLTGKHKVFHVQHSVAEMLRTELLVWRAYSLICQAIEEEYKKL